MRHSAHSLCTALCIAIVGNLSATVPSHAKDPTESDSNSKKTSAPESSELPKCLDKLNLSDDQKTKAREIVGKYDAKIEKTWKRFSAKYMDTVRTEVALLVAVEDHLSDAQRESVRTERSKVAQSEQATEKQAPEKSNAKADAANRKPTAVVEEIDEIYLGNGISLTVEQEAIVDQITNKHLTHLRKLHRDVHAIHNRLIALEADKIIELEKLLTKEQLKQLREERQSTSPDHNVTATSR